MLSLWINILAPSDAMNILLLVLMVLHAASCSSLTLDRHFSDLSQQSSKNNVSLLRAETTPNPFIFDYSDNLRVIFYHNGASWRRPSPGVSPYNWMHAISQAGIIALALQQHSHAQGQDHVPGNIFAYEDKLLRPGPRPRRIRFEIKGPHNFRLRYNDIHVVLLASYEYARIFERGTRNDQIRMCTFTLIWQHHEQWHEISQGSVTMIDLPISTIQSTA